MKSYCVIFVVATAVLYPGIRAQQSADEIPKGATLVTGELVHAIDAKKAKTGDKITLRLVNNVVRDGKIIVPYTKGTVVGYISAVQSPTKEDHQCMVTIEFEKIVVKGKDDLPIEATVWSMVPPDHHMIRHSGGSVPTSGDNAQARAAGPMTDSNGSAVIPAHAPVSQAGPRTRASMNDRPSGMEGVRIEADPATHTTVITSNNKSSLWIEDNTRIKLIVSTTAF